MGWGGGWQGRNEEKMDVGDVNKLFGNERKKSVAIVRILKPRYEKQNNDTNVLLLLLLLLFAICFRKTRAETERACEYVGHTEKTGGVGGLSTEEQARDAIAS